MKKTALRRFSRGIVIEDKEADSRLVKVWPYEILPILDGVIDSELKEYKNDGIDHDAKKWEHIAKVGYWIECEWLGERTNRVFPPNLKRREHVTIWRAADSHRYYWTESGREDHLRRLEHVLYAYSDVPPEVLEDVDLTGENTYTNLWSTREGRIHWRTAKSNGEDFLYDFLIDTANSQVFLKDDTNNMFSIDSTEKIVRLDNADGAFLELNKKDINGYAPENWNMEAVEAITFKCKTFTMTATDSVSIETKDFSVKASSSFKVDSPNSSFTGNVSIGKNLTVTGQVAAANGAMNVAPGTVSFTVPVSGSSPITAPNIP